MRGRPVRAVVFAGARALVLWRVRHLPGKKKKDPSFRKMVWRTPSRTPSPPAPHPPCVTATLVTTSDPADLTLHISVRGGTPPLRRLSGATVEHWRAGSWFSRRLAAESGVATDRVALGAVREGIVVRACGRTGAWSARCNVTTYDLPVVRAALSTVRWSEDDEDSPVLVLLNLTPTQFVASADADTPIESPEAAAAAVAAEAAEVAEAVVSAAFAQALADAEAASSSTALVTAGPVASPVSGALKAVQQTIGAGISQLGTNVKHAASEVATTAMSATIDKALAVSAYAGYQGRQDLLVEHHLMQYHAPRGRPPPPQFALQCQACLDSGVTPSGATFGLTLHRHHCAHCGGSYCAEHLQWRERIDHKFDLNASSSQGTTAGTGATGATGTDAGGGHNGASPLSGNGASPASSSATRAQRVCWACVCVLRREAYENLLAERLCRCADFIHGGLAPYMIRCAISPVSPQYLPASPRISPHLPASPCISHVTTHAAYGQGERWPGRASVAPRRGIAPSCQGAPPLCTRVRGGPFDRRHPQIVAHWSRRIVPQR